VQTLLSVITLNSAAVAVHMKTVLLLFWCHLCIFVMPPSCGLQWHYVWLVCPSVCACVPVEPFSGWLAVDFWVFLQHLSWCLVLINLYLHSMIIVSSPYLWACWLIPLVDWICWWHVFWYLVNTYHIVAVDDASILEMSIKYTATQDLLQRFYFCMP